MIDLAPITSGAAVNDTLSAIEVVALLRGAVRVDELVWDDDALTSWYIDERVDPELQAAYREESRTAVDEAREVTLGELAAEMERRRDLLGLAYPFTTNIREGLFLELGPNEACIPQTACYLWLALFRASQSDDDHLTLSQNAKDAVRTHFANVFEIISAYALLGRADGPIWYLGSSRSVDRLLAILGYITSRIASGEVKARHQLLANQINANDAGIDAILIERQEPFVGYLLGATIQKSDRRKKIIGRDEVLRFHDFFVNRIGSVFLGVLATPYEPREDERINCADRRCLYFHGDLIMELLGKSVNCVARETRHLRYVLRAQGRKLHQSLAGPDVAPLINCPWA
jgi:hypothetical protein